LDYLELNEGDRNDGKEFEDIEPFSIAENSKKAFCEKCREYKPYNVKVIKRSKEIDHRKVYLMKNCPIALIMDMKSLYLN
jgi:hypothetical protein